MKAENYLKSYGLKFTSKRRELVIAAMEDYKNQVPINVNSELSLFPDQNSQKKTLFSDSIYSDFNLFQKKLHDDLPMVDLFYYYNSVSDWSDSSNKKRTARGWIATAKQFMRGDKEKNKLKFVKTDDDIVKANNETVEYLNNFK